MIVMKYARNGSLRRFLPRTTKFNWQTKLDLLGRIITGLETIHQSNLVHRDLHDGNILRIHREFSVISDLGLCRPTDYFNESITERDSVYGVIPYMAPEVL
jgi:serine/threonine protein kinase